MKLSYVIWCFLIVALFSCTQASVDVYEKSPGEANPYLSSITIDGAEIEGFTYNKGEYRDYIQGTAATKTIQVGAVSYGGGARIVGDVGAYDLVPGVNRLVVSVMSENSLTKFTYQLVLIYDNGTMPVLENLKINGSAVEGFSPDKNEYWYYYDETGDTFDKVTHTIDMQVYQSAAVVSVVREDLQGSDVLTVTGDGVKRAIVNLNIDKSIFINDVKVSVTGEDGLSVNEYVVRFKKRFVNAYQNFTDMSDDDISDLFDQYGFKTVITGDSLSVGYGFMGEGVRFAYSTYPGILSWSHSLRDAIIRNDKTFVHADDLIDSVDSTGVLREDIRWFERWGGLSDGRYVHMFNNRNLTLRSIKPGDELEINYEVTQSDVGDGLVLYFAKTPYALGCSFKIKVDNDAINEFNLYTCNDTLSNSDNYVNVYNNVSTDVVDTYSSNRSVYQGFAPIMVEIPNVTKKSSYAITLYDFQHTGTGDGDYLGFFFLGIGTKLAPVYLTGQSAINTKHMLDQIDTRILNHNPDFVTLIIGANDSASEYNKINVTNCKSNLISIIDKIYDHNSACKILLIGPPMWDENNSGVYEEEVLVYMEAIREVAVTKKCLYIDSALLFEGGTSWRQLYVHFTKSGNTELAKCIVSNVLSESHFVTSTTKFRMGLGYPRDEDDNVQQGVLFDLLDARNIYYNPNL